MKIQRYLRQVTKLLFALLALMIIFVAVSAIGFLPKIPYRTADNLSFLNETNEQIAKLSPLGRWAKSGFHIGEISSGANAGEFIGIAASGGGSRAAIFTAAVMEELDKLGILEKTNVISSVSGGGLPSAYFALHSQDLLGKSDQWEQLQTKLVFDYKTRWLWRTVAPWNLIPISLTDMDRSDVMADVLDDALFEQKTFRELAANGGPGKPKWIATATDVTAGGSAFRFEYEHMRKSLNADLSQLRIARAVQTSAAFPAAFNSVSIRAYDNKYKANDRFKHLIDGGASDNLGIDALLDAAWVHAEKYQGSAEFYGKRPFACMLFIVDAYTPKHTIQLGHLRDGRESSVSHVVDLNFLDAIDASLSHRRRAQLNLLGFPVEYPKRPHGAQLLSPDTKNWVGSNRDRRFANSSTERGFQRIRPYPFPGKQGEDLSCKRNTGDEGFVDQTAARIALDDGSYIAPVREKGLSCNVWHISLAGIRSIVLPSDSSKTPSTARPANTVSDLAKFRDSVWNVTTRVPTDFNLKGPTGCKNEMLGKIIRTAAEIAVQEDGESIAKVCEWFGRHFERTPGESRCRPKPEREYRTTLADFKILEMPNGDVSCTQ